MPLSADPDRTVDFWLESDADKPIESRPVFVCRFMTHRQHRKIRELLDKIRSLGNDDSSDEKCFQMLSEVFSIGIVGWRNFGRDFSIEAIGEELTDWELFELAHGYPARTRLEEVDLKKSASPSTSSSMADASAAGTPKAA